MARFYLHSVHSRLRWGDAADIVQPKGWLGSVDNYRDKICRCHQCQELLNEKGSAEKAFELYLEQTLIEKSGWQKGTNQDWDKQRVLFPSEIVAFIKDTQADLWAEMRKSIQSISVS